MALFKRHAKDTPTIEQASAPTAPVVTPRLTPDGKGITFPDKAAMDHWKRRVAEAGLTVRGVEYNGQASYLTLAGSDAERAKAFLRDEHVDRKLYYIVVETLDGVWGLDIDGLYLEHLRPWQMDTGSAEYQVPAGSVAGNPHSVNLAMQGTVDNFLVWIGCGRCAHRWADGVRYQNRTLTRCPSCGAKNLVDSSNVQVVLVDERPRPSSPLSSSLSEQSAYTGIKQQRAQIARRIAELVDANQVHYGELTEEQQSRFTDWRHLDAVISSGEAPPDWISRAVELRSIGHQLNREGGTRLMQETAAQADRLSKCHTVLGVIVLFWDSIGDWQG
ncbi:hypothetical protein ACFXI6_32475 [Streptomyces mirabilis]|uniref:hypothetical protein n=1 Tax=Streptomyces mirabilis TaxID=68239 RepID=UPI0036BE1111